MTPLIVSLLKIGGSVALLTAVLWAVARAGRALALPPELSRKLIHVSLGLYCLTFPWVFAASWEVAATCALAIAVFALARGALKTRLGAGLHGVARVSHGEILFAVSVAVLFHLKDGHWLQARDGSAEPQLWLYLLPLAVLTLSDAASALIGSRWGRATFRVGEGRKTWEGVAAFAVTAWGVGWAVLALFAELTVVEAGLLALIAALFGALFEGASWRGLDNLFIPIGLYVVLSSLAPLGALPLAGVALGFAAALAALVLLARPLRLNRHVVASLATMAFCIGAVSGPLSVLTPAFAVAAWAGVRRLEGRWPPADEALNLIATGFALALAVFVVSDLLQADTIFAFNLAFAALAAAAVARFAPRAGPTIAVLVAVAAWLLMNVRTLMIEGARLDTLLFSVLALGLILIVTARAYAWRANRPGRPWLQVGAAALAAGLLGQAWRT